MPFRGESSGVIFKAILDGPHVCGATESRRAAKLEEIINKALEKDRNLRYQHAADMRADLQRLKRDTEGGHFSTAISAPGPVARTPGPRVGKLWKIWVPVVALALIVAGSLYYRSQQSNRLTDKDSIVLGDFDNKTSDSVFDDTLKQGFSVQLEQSPFFDLVSETQDK